MRKVSLVKKVINGDEVLGKNCTICKTFKSYDEYAICKSHSTGRGTRCKECMRKLWHKNKNPRKNEIWSKDKIINKIISLNKENSPLHLNYIKTNYTKLYGSSLRYFGSWEKAIESSGLNYTDIKKVELTYWDKESIVENIRNYSNRGLDLSYSSMKKLDTTLVSASSHHFGSWAEAIRQSGFDYNTIKEEKHREYLDNKTFWSKDKALKELKQLYDENPLNLNTNYLNEHHSYLYRYCRINFKDFNEVLENLGIDRSLIKEIINEDKRNFSKTDIINHIQRIYLNKGNLSDNSISIENVQLYGAARRQFGSWHEAVKQAGISYEFIRNDVHRSSYQGCLFERLLDDILTEIGIVFSKYKHDIWRPDYVMKNGVWGDAKLSEWTVHKSETIDRYEPHCKMLAIIYMRGKKNVDKMITSKTRLISVDLIIKQLPLHRQRYYNEKIKNIEIAVNNVESNQKIY